MTIKTRLSLLLAVPLALCFLGAAAPATYTRERALPEGGTVYLTEIGGCHYVIAFRYGTGVSIIHHAACTNPAHTVKPSTP